MAIASQRVVDRIFGSFLALVLAPFVVRRAPPQAPRRICIVKLWAIGESILTLPMIAALKKRFPDATIDVLARQRNQDVYRGQQFINQILSIPDAARCWKSYDLCIDCEPYLNVSALLCFWLGRSTLGFSHGLRRLLYNTRVQYNDNQHVVLAYMDLLRPYDLERRPSALIPLRYDKADNEAVNLLLKEIPAGKFLVGIEAGAAESALCRMWDRRKFAELCDKLVDDGCAIAFVGAGHEAGLNAAIIAMMRNKKNVINTAGRVRLTAFFCFAKRLDMMISNDTGSMHIAAAQGTPTIGLFCPNTPVRFAPYGKRNASIYKPVLPEPCINVHKAEIGNNCSTHNHMSRIEVVDVYGAYRTLRRMRT